MITFIEVTKVYYLKTIGDNKKESPASLSKLKSVAEAPEIKFRTRMAMRDLRDLSRLGRTRTDIQSPDSP